MILFRLVRTNPPGETDFMSSSALDDPAYCNPATMDFNDPEDGISCQATIPQLLRRARILPGRGFISRLELPDSVPDEVQIRWLRTFRNRPGHHTVWGAPNTLLRYVTETHSLDHFRGDQDHDNQP